MLKSPSRSAGARHEELISQAIASPDDDRRGFDGHIVAVAREDWRTIDCRLLNGGRGLQVISHLAGHTMEFQLCFVHGDAGLWNGGQQHGPDTMWHS